MKGVQVGSILHGPFTMVHENATAVMPGVYCYDHNGLAHVLPFNVVGEDYEILDDPEFPAPQVEPPPVPQQVTALQGMLALDHAGLSAAFEAWANDPARTFAERAFINKALTWKRNDPVLLEGAAALGITDLDPLFILAASL